MTWPVCASPVLSSQLIHMQDQERSSQSQKAMASDLRTLLQAKLRVASGGTTWAASGGAPAHAFKSVEVVDKVRSPRGWM